MMRRSILLALLTCFLSSAASANEIGYLEDFALAADREEALGQLIPGTEDYYYYHALNYQNTEQFQKGGEVLAAWIKRHGYTARVQEIRHRQALLTYEKSPDETLAHLRKELKLHFNHQREPLDKKPDLPTALDQQQISRATLTKRALAQYQNLQGFEDSALDWLVEMELNADRRRNLLQRLSRPDHANLPELVVADLNHQYSGGFGSFEIHRQLLHAQLDSLLKLKPELLNHTNFVNAYISKLHPNPDADWRHDPAERKAYLERLWAFVERLAPAHNSLKAHVLYHRLVFDRAQGVYDKDRFMTYVKLPRYVPYINNQYMQIDAHRRHPADLSADFSNVTLLPIVGSDEPLVRSYLAHFFIEETAYKPYETYINDTYLKHLFAEVKIVNGLGEGEEWYSMLPPAQYQALKERIDLDFAYTNDEVFGPDEPVALDLYVKNVETLIVKVFEINTFNYYREQGHEITTDIDLDGLVPNYEETHAYKEPPLRRVRRHFAFPKLNKRGVYVIDFIGNGRASRAVVRKGKLRYLARTGTAGHVFTVLNEENEKLADASIWLAGHEYQANENGQIVVPFSSNPSRQAMILSHGGFSSLDHFQHLAENYELTAGIYVDREALIERQQAKVLVRPGLYLAGVPVTLSLLEDVRLVLTSTDIDGVSTTKEVEDFKLFEDRESYYEFQVPARLVKITFTLKAKVKRQSDNEETELSATQAFALNQIDQTDKIEQPLLSNVGGKWVLDLLGKTGEPLAERAVQLVLKHGDFRDPVHVSLETNVQGRIVLGELEGISQITATAPDGVSRSWNLPRDQHTYYSARHAEAGETIEVAYTGRGDEPDRDELSLLEVRTGTFVRDAFEALSIEGGLVKIKGLTRGDYDLLLKNNNRRITLRVTEGNDIGSHVLGENRHLEVRGENPLAISAIEAQDDVVRVTLQNAGKYSRLHVFATRFEPAYSAFGNLARVQDVGPYVLDLDAPESLYVAGRSIGDEYQYIIDRKYAKKYPGNMLERPSLLLNPWAIRTTETGHQEALAGEEYDRLAPDDSGLLKRYGGAAGSEGGHSAYATLDFLRHGSAVLVNLVPDEKGVVEIKREELGAHQHLHFIAVDPLTTAYRALALPEARRDYLDLRLADSLDPQLHFTEKKQISIVRGEEKFVLADVTSSRFEAYDNLAKVYALYATLSSDPKLIEFSFIVNWPQLKPEEKRAKYSEYACHELNFFLHQKDPQFFEEVVQPYLANKKEKTFLDGWLLGMPVEHYLEPWEHGQLNIVERILLARRIEGERQHTARSVRERYELLPPDIDRFNFLFNTAIQGSAFDTDDAFGFSQAKTKATEAEPLPEPQAGGLGGGKAGGVADMAETPSNNDPFAGAPADRPAPAAPPAKQSAKPGADAKRESGERNENLKKALEEKHRSEASSRRQRDMDGVKDDYFDDERALRSEARQFYRKLDKTKEWVENNYYKLPKEQQNADLIAVNAFWNDYASHDPQQPFLSTHLAEASRNFPEMMFALAVLDLPFEPEKHKTQFVATAMTLQAAGPLVIYHEEIEQAEKVAEETPILVSQNFFRHGDRYRYENNEQLDKYVTDEFLVHTVYGCQIVVTNPTSSPQKLDVLLQIPEGALPVSGAKLTRSVHINLAPYNTQTLEYYFYFPLAGKFPHYPVHVSKNEEVIAYSDPMTFNVVNELSRLDTASWAYLSQHGTEDQVISHLRQHNIFRIDLDRIAWRMRDKAFFNRVIELLATRHAYNNTLWSYGVYHNAVGPMREFLQHADAFVRQCGDYLVSPILVIDPVERKWYEHKDYRPLVNARQHQLGRERQILNDRFHGQYHQLLKILSYHRALGDEHLMAVTYYMLLQDRVEEGVGFFGRVNPQQLAARLQYDYFQAYLNMYLEQPQAAKEIAQQHAEHPVDRWKNAFVSVVKQVDEIDAVRVDVVDEKDRSQVQSGLAASEPSIDFLLEGPKVVLNYQNLDAVTVNYYLMDVELLFSGNPFVQRFSSQFSLIQPNQTQTVKLPAEKTVATFALPDELATKNVLVEIKGGGRSQAQAYYSNTLTVQTIENYGQVRITKAGTGDALPKVYVKVYARMNDGQVRFYKDGYTDLRGRFDYTSLNTNELEAVDRFALLVLDDQYGAVVREAKPPKR